MGFPRKRRGLVFPAVLAALVLSVALAGAGETDTGCDKPATPPVANTWAFHRLEGLPLFDLSDHACRKLARAKTVPYPDPTDSRVDAEVAALSKVISNFHFVSPGRDPFKDGLYRGGAPVGEQLEQLRAKLRIKTILNIENDLDTALDPRKGSLSIGEERAKAEKAGIRYISIHMRATFCEPSDKVIKKILEVLEDRENYPLYVHCLLGEDRTGLVVGLYRHFVEGVSASMAYEEMCQHDFKPHLELGFQCAYRKLTGLPVPRRCELAHLCKQHRH